MEKIAIIVPLSVLLAWVSLVDFQHRRIPNGLNLCVFLVGLVFARQVNPIALGDCLVGAGAGFLIFFVVGEVYFRIRNIDGLGLGDAKLLGALGVWLGWQLLPLVILLSSLGALTYGICMRDQSKSIPFGPFLGFSSLICLIFTAFNGNL